MHSIEYMKPCEQLLRLLVRGSSTCTFPHYHAVALEVAPIAVLRVHLTVLWQHGPIAASPIARLVYRPQSYSPTDLTPYSYIGHWAVMTNSVPPKNGPPRQNILKFTVPLDQLFQ